MRRSMIWVAIAATLPVRAIAQPFEVSAGFQSVHVDERIVDPAFCEGIEFFAGRDARDLDPLGGIMSHRFRCGPQRTAVSVRVDSDARPDRLSGQMEGTCEIGSEKLVTQGRCEAGLMGWYEARLSTAAWRRFRLVGRINVEASILPGDGEFDFGYATISVERGRIGGLDEIYFSQVVSVQQPGVRVIDAIVDVSAGEFTVFMGMEQFELEQNTAVQLGTERISADLEFEFTALPCSADIDWDNRVDMQDLGILLAHLYQVEGREGGDLNGDRYVDLSDLAELLAEFGTECRE